MTPLVTLTRAQMPKIGVCVRRDPLNTSAVGDLSLLAMLTEVGARVARLTLDWAQVERSRGVYTWTQYESFIAALKAAGIVPLLILQEGNPLYTGEWFKPPITPEAQAAYAQFFKAAVGKFGQGSTVYEVQNEPNHFDAVYFTPDQYASLLSAVLTATASLRPSWLLTGGLSYHDRDNWLRAVAVKADLSKVTAIGHHPYTGGDAYPGDPMCRPEAMGANLDAVAKIGGRPALNTEAGVSVTECAGATWDDQHQRQAVHAERFVYASAIANRPFSCWYGLQDVREFEGGREGHFGLFDASGAIKPSGIAFGWAMRQLAASERTVISAEASGYRATFQVAQTETSWTA